MKRVFLLILFALTFISGFSQQGKYGISYFSPREYGKSHEAANWACVQDKNGVLYFGNAGGLLQFDGVNWNFIPVKQQSVWVKALAVSEDNVIYVGAQNEFGYLAPDVTGRLTYVSLSDKLSADRTSFNEIIRIWSWNDTVAFQSQEALFLFSGEAIETVLPETSFHLSFLVNNELFVRQRNIGIMKLTGDKLQLVENGDFFKNIGISDLLPGSVSGKLIGISREDGFWSIDKETFIATEIKTGNDPLFRESGIYGAKKLGDGKIALNTLSNGIFICDEQFNIISHFNKNNGLKVNGVLSLIQDFQGNIWAGLDNGIVQLWYSSPLEVFTAEAGVSGNINAIEEYNGKLFIGSTEGLFIFQGGSSFNRYPGFIREVRSLCQAEGSLLAGTLDGLFEIKHEGLSCISNENTANLYYSDKVKVLFVSGNSGLVLYHYTGSWKKIMVVPEITEEIIGFAEEPGINETTLWMGTALDGIIRLKYGSESAWQVDKYSGVDGLISNTWAYPVKINDQVIFSQRSGLWQFVNEESIRAQLPDSLKNVPEYYRGYFDFFAIGNSKELQEVPFYTIKDTKDRIYANMNGDIGYFQKSDSLTWVQEPFVLADIGKTNLFFHQEDGFCWIGGNDGIIRFNENKYKNYKLGFGTILTSVYCNGDSLLYSGYNVNTHFPLINTFSEGIPILDYACNSVSFNFAATFFEGQEQILYSYTLEGQDKNYSKWQADNKVVFTNLREGNYTFKVKAKNAYGQISSESIFRFSVLSPWYRTFWSYLFYTALFVFCVFAGIRINSRRLIAKNKKLEAIILERTHEIKQKNIVLEHQKKEILDSINYAQRIQKAVLPDETMSKSWLGEHFILFRPKDIVSGDFYWAAKRNNYVFFCVADCTGHGVPGAFMSMLCISFLNEVVLKDQITDSAEILGSLRKMIIESLKQKGVEGEQKDGMDISLCILNTTTLEMEYSGANNPLYVIRERTREEISSNKQMELNNHILYEIKGDSMPIAIHVNMNPFKKHNIKLQGGDQVYLFSDGIADQFGGPFASSGGKKLMYKGFKALLLNASDLHMDDQLLQIKKGIDEWMSCPNPESGDAYDQVDDICLMGVKV